MFTTDDAEQLMKRMEDMVADRDLPEPVRQQAAKLAAEAYWMKNVLTLHADKIEEIDESRRMGL